MLKEEIICKLLMPSMTKSISTGRLNSFVCTLTSSLTGNKEGGLSCGPGKILTLLDTESPERKKIKVEVSDI